MTSPFEEFEVGNGTEFLEEVKGFDGRTLGLCSVKAMSTTQLGSGSFDDIMVQKC